MSTPAQLLAKKHAEAEVVPVPAPAPVTPITTPTPPATTSSTSVSSADSPSTLATDVSAAEESFSSATSAVPVAGKKKHVKKIISMDDDEAFPSLGSSVGAAPPLSWGVSSNGNKKNGGYAQAAAASSTSTFRQAFKSSNTQLTFIIDADQQVELPKADIFKIFSRIKQLYGVNIESTLSSATNKRTFLLSGPASSIQDAKRNLLKKLTKPVKIQFAIPSSLRSAIIGSQGRTLKPILDATRTKIDIERSNEDESPDVDDDDDVFGKMLTATVEGDIAGCEEAKSRILAIVNEHTKTLSVRIAVDPELKSFLPGSVDKLNFPRDLEITYPDVGTKSANILVSGPREGVLDARDQIKQLLVTLGSTIVTEEHDVPKRVHSLLDAQKVFENTNVIIKVPGNDSESDTVQFIGAKDQIPAAMAYAKQLCANYFVDSLDLARSHGGNSPHAKSLTAYFVYTKFLDELSAKYGVDVSAPSYASLANDDIKTVTVTFTCPKEKKDVLKQVRKEVVDSVNKITPNLVRVVTDIDSFVFTRIGNVIAVENGVSIVPLGSLSGSGNKLILILQQSDDEFLPSGQEIQQKLDSVDSSLDDLRELSKTVVSKVIPADSEDQEHLSGKTLEVLLGKFEPNSIEIKLHQNASGPSPNEIFLRGFKLAVDPAVADISQAIEDIKNYEEACKYNFTISFPTKHLSRFIGHNGNHLNELREKYDVRLDVLDETSEKDKDKDEDGVTPVLVTGLKRNVDECIKHLDDLSKRWSDEKTIVMKIDPKYHRRLIGSGGVYVNKLQDRYKVSVRFPHENDKDHKDEVIIRGPSKGVSKAKGEMKELLQYEQENGYSETIKVPTEALSRLIGKNGEQIKDISAATGASINNLKASQEQEKKQGFAKFEIVGSRSGIKNAKDSIQNIIDRVENFTTVTIKVDPKWHRYLIGPGGSTKRQIILKAGGSDDNVYEFRKYLQIPSRGSDSDEIVCSGDKKIIDNIVGEVERIVAEQESITTEVVQIPKKKHRLLVGPGGSVRRSLEEEFKVNISIPKVNVESDDVKIRGLPDQIVKAKAKIEELTR
ncbi:DEKNAAC104631 [Brettanomyces naardenensis]|uniref:DEKNAAC104631 n=1 Tax=Brettanomyces naardenensis TaxID=13370 RepID=A0A448YR10_BRENA|nr:DEKNAAC104631 [Brettanomyces naardenensis]